MSPGLSMAISFGAAGVVFATLALWDWQAPRRKLAAGRRPRWPGNLGIWLIDAAVVRLFGPVMVVGAALLAAEKGWGLFAVASLPRWATIVLGVIALDLTIYAQRLPSRAVAVAVASRAPRRP
jgi:hypothetical protein